MLGSWGAWLGGRGLGDDYLRVGGLFTEPVKDAENSLRARTTASLTASVKVVRPTAQCDDLVLSRARMKLLQSAISRLDLQATVLHLLGLDPYQFGVLRSGLNSRLIGPTDEGQVRTEIMA